MAAVWLPSPWGVVLVLGALVVEIGEATFWIRLSHRLRPATGVQTLVGAEGVAATDCRPLGSVRVQGELWGAVCPEGVSEGEAIVVESVSGLTLRVRPK